MNGRLLIAEELVCRDSRRPAGPRAKRNFSRNLRWAPEINPSQSAMVQDPPPSVNYPQFTYCLLKLRKVYLVNEELDTLLSVETSPGFFLVIRLTFKPVSCNMLWWLLCLGKAQFFSKNLS